MKFLHLLKSLVKHYLCLWICVLGMNFTVVAQNNLQFTPPHHNANYYHYQDDEGFFWVSSLAGWYRFDGRSYEHFPVPKKDGEYKYSQNIQSSFFPDEDGNLWFTTYDGLHMMSPETGQISSQRLVWQEDTLSYDYQIIYHDRREKKLWLVANEQLFDFQPSSGNLNRALVSIKAKRFAVDTFKNGSPRTIIGGYYIVGPGLEVIHRRSEQDSWSHHQITEYAETSLPKISGLHLTAPGTGYLSSNTGLIDFSFDTDDFKLTNFSYEKSQNGTACNFITTDDKNNVIYFICRNQGIQYAPLDKHGKFDPDSVRRITSIPNPKSLFFTERGYKFVSRRNEGFSVLFPGQANAVKAIEKNYFRTKRMLLAPNGKIYASDTDGLIHSRSRNTESFWTTENGFKVDTSKSISIFSSNTNLYRFGNSLTAMSFEKGKIEVYQPYLGQAKKILVNEENDLLLHNWTSLFEISPPYDSANTRQQPTFSQFKKFEFDYFRYLGNSTLAGSYQSKDMWIFDWQSDQINLINKYPINADLYFVTSGNKKGHYWMGTDKGLLLTTSPDHLSTYTPQSFSQNFIVREIINHTSGLLILSTNLGLSLFHPVEKKFRYFPPAHSAYDAPNAYRDFIELSSGEVLAICNDSIVHFSPDSLWERPCELSPYIKNIVINGIAYQSDQSIKQIEYLKLPYFKNSLDIQINTLGISTSLNDKVSFTLNGTSKRSNVIGPTDYIPLHGLSPGEYLLSYYAIDGTGAQSIPKTLKIRIAKPLWLKGWFLCLVISSLLGLGFFLNRLITRRQLLRVTQRLEKQEAVAAERERIASELHDDLGGDLASMAFIIDGHNSLKELGVDAKLDVSRLGQLANGAIKHMREMIWVLDDEQATLPTLAKQLFANAREMAEVADLSLQADIPDNLPEIPLSSTQKKNILLMAKEAMQNIRKHAKASAFNLRLAVEREGEHSSILLVITDNGQGLKATQQEEADKPLNHGHGLKNLHKRAEEINAALTLEAAIPRGTKVTLRCPIVQNTAL